MYTLLHSSISYKVNVFITKKERINAKKDEKEGKKERSRRFSAHCSLRRTGSVTQFCTGFRDDAAVSLSVSSFIQRHFFFVKSINESQINFRDSGSFLMLNSFISRVMDAVQINRRL